MGRSSAENIKTALERTKKWLLGGRGKGIDGVETSIKFKGEKKGRRLKCLNADSNKKRYEVVLSL